MSRLCIALCCSTVALALCVCGERAAQADGFEPVGARAVARWFGVGFGQGYHTVPCAKHLADHYQRSVQGIVHPAHRWTPVYHQNTPHSCRLRHNPNERAPYYVGNTMPPAHWPSSSRAPMYRAVTTPGSLQPQPMYDLPTPATVLPGDGAAEFESITPEMPGTETPGPAWPEDVLPEPQPLEPAGDLDKETRFQRLPAVSEGDGSQFGDVELDIVDEYPEAALDPLRGHPLWEENGPARPRLYDDAATQLVP